MHWLTGLQPSGVLACLGARRPGDDDDELVSDRLGGLRLLHRHERRSKVLLVIVCHRDRVEKVEWRVVSNSRRQKLTSFDYLFCKHMARFAYHLRTPHHMVIITSGNGWCCLSCFVLRKILYLYGPRKAVPRACRSYLTFAPPRPNMIRSLCKVSSCRTENRSQRCLRMPENV